MIRTGFNIQIITKNLISDLENIVGGTISDEEDENIIRQLTTMQIRSRHDDKIIEFDNIEEESEEIFTPLTI